MKDWIAQRVFLIGIRPREYDGISFSYFSFDTHGYFLSYKGYRCRYLRRAIRFDSFVEAADYLSSFNKNDKYIYDVLCCEIGTA